MLLGRSKSICNESVFVKHYLNIKILRSALALNAMVTLYDMLQIFAIARDHFSQQFSSIPISHIHFVEKILYQQF